MSRLLEARALCAYYGPTQVLFGLDLGVEAGGITTLLGANGAGKTTTLRSLSGMCRTDGEIRFDGKPIAGRATEDIVRLGIAHVPRAGHVRAPDPGREPGRRVTRRDRRRSRTTSSASTAISRA